MRSSLSALFESRCTSMPTTPTISPSSFSARMSAFSFRLRCVNRSCMSRCKAAERMARSDGPSGFKIPSATSRLAARRFAVSVESAERKVTGAKNVTETRSVAHTSVMLLSERREKSRRATGATRHYDEAKRFEHVAVRVGEHGANIHTSCSLLAPSCGSSRDRSQESARG